MEPLTQQQILDRLAGAATSEGNELQTKTETDGTIRFRIADKGSDTDGGTVHG